VGRVLQRLTGGHLTVQQSWERAEALLSRSRAGDFNQSMMELGATVCLPRDPRCLACPVREFCATRGERLRSPSTVAKLSTRQLKREIWCALDRRDGHVRLVKRGTKTTLMAGMWELPQCPELPHPSAKKAPWRTFRHSITVTDYRVHVLRDWKLAGSFARGKWVAIDRIPDLPLTGLARKVLKAHGII
jgi:A/G-specific adenine glycosylase